MSQTDHNLIEDLLSEHESILARLDDLEKIINKSTINRAKIADFFHFTETFAEPHHQKEEQVLFPALEKKGIPNQGGPIGMMLIEHTAKRNYLAQMKQALKENNKNQLKKTAQAMISLLREHIYKENQILYPCAYEVLSNKELVTLTLQGKNLKL